MKLKVVSLFSGAGGLDLGFEKAGFEIIWANEFDKNIWETYEKNFPNTFLCKKSIKDIDTKEIPDCDIIIGGPPCQSFSEAGKQKGVKDPRGQLFYEYIRVLKDKKPKVFVAENVSGLLAKKHKNDLDNFLKEFKNAGYNVSVELYNTHNYNCAQDRLRIIFVGVRKDLNITFNKPKESNNKLFLKDIISNMPAPIKTVNGKNNIGICSILNHEYLDSSFSPMFMSRNRVRTWQEPSFTILATARQIPLHPQAPLMIKQSKDKFIFDKNFLSLYRRLSVRECAKIQGFPDNFEFVYKKIEDGYKMVGNAVAVPLAFTIAKQIKKLLKK